MEPWQRDLEYVALGVGAAVAVELLTGPAASDNGHGARRWSRLLLAGGTAAAYAHLIPAAHWGPRSALAFVRLPLVAGAQGRLAGTPPVRLALWGALAGLLFRSLGER